MAKWRWKKDGIKFSIFLYLCFYWIHFILFALLVFLVFFFQIYILTLLSIFSIFIFLLVFLPLSVVTYSFFYLFVTIPLIFNLKLLFTLVKLFLLVIIPLCLLWLTSDYHDYHFLFLFCRTQKQWHYWITILLSKVPVYWGEWLWHNPQIINGASSIIM